METIEEQSKCEMSISSSPSPENLRICLVGDVINDASCLDAAQSFGVPVITSETGLELINDYDWRTYFVLKEFDGPIYDSIHRNKQCILGPPALKQASQMKDGLLHNARPIYNYSMRGVVTCFTGIRKKDELTKLVNLIHSMGGCIRKDMNSKITHLISTHSGGDKYQYAKTFRLTVVRPAWVYAAWELREETDFKATTEDFSKEHKLKAFEGQKICFFGFPVDEQQHMIDVLKSNGGVPAELDDPECSHVVMPNSGGYFSEILSTNSNTNYPSNVPNTNIKSTPTFLNKSSEQLHEAMEVDQEDSASARASAACQELNNDTSVTQINNQSNFLRALNKNNDNMSDEEEGENYDHFDERLVVDLEDQCKFRQAQSREDDELVKDLIPVYSDNELVVIPQVTNTHDASTPKSSRCIISQNKLPLNISLSVAKRQTNDEVVDNELLSNLQSTVDGGNISPIFGGATTSDKLVVNFKSSSPIVSPQKNATPPMIVDDLEDATQWDLKRKRESFDNVSLISMESFVQPRSTKKPKLLRTASFTRTIRRSISFVAKGTPKILRTRRNSVALDSAPNDVDTSAYLQDNADDSLCSTASIDTTFNESVCKPVKEKLKSLRNHFTRTNSRKEKYAFQRSPERDTTTADHIENNDGFKTPKAPLRYPSLSFACQSAPRPQTRSLTKMCNKSLNLSTIDGPICDSPVQCNKPFLFSNPSNPSAKINNNKALSDTDNILHNLSSPISHTNTKTVLCQSNQALQVNPNLSHHHHHHHHAIEKPREQHTNLNSNLISSKVPDNNSELSPSRNTVVDEHATQTKPEPKNHRTHILKSDWFWYTIQNGYADEMDYLFGDYLDSIANTPCTDRRDSLPISFNKRKRKRISQRLQLEGTPLGSGKRRSSVSDAGLLSVSGSFFDCTTSPDKLEHASNKLLTEPETSTCDQQTPVKKLSMRCNHFMDFFSTESNYVGILDTIVNLFKNPLEELAEGSDALINKSEVRAIFGNFIPIHEVHQSMLERLRAINSHWTEDCLIGDIILHHRDDLIKAYPPYVNFFEKMKETLVQCDTQNPRFHAFLKINQAKPECGRQSLQDLMIRPVQRLPSISLLLNDILKHTSKNNPDYVRLEEAMKAIKEVMMHINEDKRRTESRMALFDIFNDIDGCPAHLVSSNRSFISRCDVSELSDNLSSRGDNLTLYLFSDSLEVCKKRSRGFNTAKSPSTGKSFKHVKLMSLNAIRFVIDITDSPRAFALLCRQDKDKLHSFTIADEEIDKVVYLRTLCKQMAENACRTDTDKALLCRTSQELEVDISDVNLSTLSKAFKLAARTRLKVGRAFSFNKTPSKLKRAVSTMMTSPFGSTNSLTPASQLAQMRLASCTNINEIGSDKEGSSIRSSSPLPQADAIIAPLSVQPTRKNSTLSSVGRI